MTTTLNAAQFYPVDTTHRVVYSDPQPMSNCPAAYMRDGIVMIIGAAILRDRVLRGYVRVPPLPERAAGLSADSLAVLHIVIARCANVAAQSSQQRRGKGQRKKHTGEPAGLLPQQVAIGLSWMLPDKAPPTPDTTRASRVLEGLVRHELLTAVVVPGGRRYLPSGRAATASAASPQEPELTQIALF